MTFWKIIIEQGTHPWLPEARGSQEGLLLRDSMREFGVSGRGVVGEMLTVRNIACGRDYTTQCICQTYRHAH